MTRECPTCLVYHVDKGLGVVPATQTTDNFTLIPTREDNVDQKRELVLTERASDQEPKGWSIKVEKCESGAVSGPHKIDEDGQEAYRSCIEWSWRCRPCREDLRSPMVCRARYGVGGDRVGSGRPMTRMAEVQVPVRAPPRISYLENRVLVDEVVARGSDPQAWLWRERRLGTLVLILE